MRASSHRRTGYHAVAHSRQRGLFTGSISVLLLTFLFPRASIRLGMRDSSEQTFCSSRTSGSKIIRLRIFLPFSGTASETKCMITLRLHLCRPLTPQWLEMERNMQVILRCRLSARLL